MDQIGKDKPEGKKLAGSSSMFNLVLWNITKALDINPNIDLKGSMKKAHEKMTGACDSGGKSGVVSEQAEEQHLQCALLAWQQLGHENPDSLCKFFESHKENKKTITDTPATVVSGPNDKAPGAVVKIVRGSRDISPGSVAGALTNNTRGKRGSRDVSPGSVAGALTNDTRGKRGSRDGSPGSVAGALTNDTWGKRGSRDVSPGSVAGALKDDTRGKRGSKDISPGTVADVLKGDTRGKRGSKDISPGTVAGALKDDTRGKVVRGSKDISPGTVAGGLKDDSQGSVESESNNDTPGMIKSKLGGKCGCKQSQGPVVKLPVIRVPRDLDSAQSSKKRTSVSKPIKKVGISSTNESKPMRKGDISSTNESKPMRKGDTSSTNESKPMSIVDPSLKNQLVMPCTLNSEGAERLDEVDKTTAELRERAKNLALREAQRVELLERAAAAWKDLERGFQRRLSLAEEKEEELKMQIENTIKERSTIKETCMSLTEELTKKSNSIDKENEKLSATEKEVFDRGCTKYQLAEECARVENALVEEQCKASHFDRDLQFKEEQTQRTLLLLEKDLESTRAISLAAQRAMDVETNTLREQRAQITEEIQNADKETTAMKKEIEILQKEREEKTKQLNECNKTCDGRKQAKVNELHKLKVELEEIKEKVMECRCKLPVDATVVAKRTPSLVALCRCSPEDRLTASCSCMSLRSCLLSNLLTDLFGGLQSELPNTGADMPCQLLKCLEDKHNWDRSTEAKTNLRNFFSRLLLGELDIAIATSLENYHATWVGATCADSKSSPRPGDKDPAREQRVVERRAQKMAAELAEQLFRQRADELAERAKGIVQKGPPPCQCQPSPQSSNQAAVYPVLIKSMTPYDLPSNTDSSKKIIELKDSSKLHKQSSDKSSRWIQTVLDVTQLKNQMEDLKKDLIKREDLKLMENKIAVILKQSSVNPTETMANNIIFNKKKNKLPEEIPVKDTKGHEKFLPPENGIKLKSKKKEGDYNKSYKKPLPQEKVNKQITKPINRQTYAVNLCLCNPRNNAQSSKVNDKGKGLIKQKQLKNVLTPSQSLRQTKPIHTNVPIIEMDNKQHDTTTILPLCPLHENCFHKIPSNKSIDELFDKLTIWKSDLPDAHVNGQNYIKRNLAPIDYKNQVTATVNFTATTISQTDKYVEHEIHVNNNVNNEDNNLNKPDNTESVYLAAINLEKSTEHACNCRHQIEMRKAAKAHCKIKKSFTKPHVKPTVQKKSTKYDFIKGTEQESQTESKKDKSCFSSLQVFTPANISNKSLFQNSHELKENNDENCELYENLNCTDPKVLISDEVEINKSQDESRSYIHKHDYHIKFLGVTLQDLSSQNLKEKPLIDSSNIKYHLPTKQNNNDCYPPIKQNVTILRPPRFHERSENIKCECEAKLEEFKDFISAILTKEIPKGNNMSSDKAIDLQSFNASNLSVGSRMYNRVNIDNSRDLEVNAFHLLEDHLKRKLEEFKSFTCKSSCISPEEEQRIFSTILKRVKQVISDCANEAKCSCVGNLSKDGSWKRAYGLLQEYLKIKIKRVQCLCEFKDKQNVNMPHVLDKVCKLIENDFQRLKEICKCRNTDELNKLDTYFTHKNSTHPADLPEKDHNYLNEKSSIRQVNKLNIGTLKEMTADKSNYIHNVCTQITPIIETDTKSCDASNKYEQTTETEVILTDNKSQGLLLVNAECNSDYDNWHPQIHVYHANTCETSPLTNVFVDNVADNKENIDISHALSLTKFNIIDGLHRKTKEVICDTCNKVPYVGCTVACSCEPSFGSCKCMKSVVQGNTDKIYKIWKGLALTANEQSSDLSYIMNSVDNTKKIPKLLDNFNDANEHIPINVNTSFDVETEVIDDEIVVLKTSTTEKLSTFHQTNTHDESPSVETEISTSEDHIGWLEEIQPSVRANTITLTNSTFFPKPQNSLNVTEINDDLDCSQSSDRCGCDKVPVCHVKMLVENIENNLLEFRCTCDSLNSKVCPVHSRQNKA